MKYKKQDSEVISGFCETLANINPEHVAEMPFMGDHIRKDGKNLTISTHDVKSITDTPHSGVLLDHGLFDEDSRGVATGQFHFSVNNLRRISREDSRHAVFFGTLHDPEGAKAEVAVKASPKRNLGEIAWYQNMAERGLMTFAPLGHIALAGEQMGYTMTVFNQEVSTLDSHDWRSFSDEEKIGKLGLVVDTAVSLHKNAIFHSDLEFRNVASDDLDDPFMVDPEFMVDISDKIRSFEESRDIRERGVLRGEIVRTMSAEFANITKSINDYIFLAMKNPPKKSMDKFRLLQQILYEPYGAKLAEQPGEYIVDIIEIFERAYAKKELDAKNELL